MRRTNSDLRAQVTESKSFLHCTAAIMKVHRVAIQEYQSYWHFLHFLLVLERYFSRLP